MDDNSKLATLTIITVTFNSIKTIEDTFNSILNQSFTPFEYIIIDGGSTDGTIEKVLKLKEKAKFNVKIISERDRGISDAFNKGIMLASGSWIHLLNSDDYYCNNFVLEELSNFFLSSKAEVICCSAIIKYDNAKKKDEIYNPRLKNNSIKYGMTLIHPSCFVRKKLFEKVGFFCEAYKVAMDYEWLSRAECKIDKNLFELVNLTTTYFRYGGISATYRKQGYREVASAQLVNTNLPTIYIILLYWLKSFFFCNKIGIISYNVINYFRGRIKTM